MEDKHQQCFKKVPFKLYSPQVQKQLLKDRLETQQQQKEYEQKASKTDCNSKQHHQQDS